MSQGIIRRAEKAMSQEDIALFLERAPVAHFATVNRNGEPYVIPNLFVHVDGAICCHTSIAGHFRNNVTADPRACFEVSEIGSVFPYGQFECDTGLSYTSVIGFGSIQTVEDDHAKVEFFDRLMAKYSASRPDRPQSFYPRLKQITLYSLKIETMTGKQQPLPIASELWPAMNRTKTPGAVAPK